MGTYFDRRAESFDALVRAVVISVARVIEREWVDDSFASNKYGISSMPTLK